MYQRGVSMYLRECPPITTLYINQPRNEARCWRSCEPFITTKAPPHQVRMITSPFMTNDRTICQDKGRQRQEKPNGRRDYLRNMTMMARQATPW